MIRLWPRVVFGPVLVIGICADRLNLRRLYLNCPGELPGLLSPRYIDGYSRRRAWFVLLPVCSLLHLFLFLSCLIAIDY